LSVDVESLLVGGEEHRDLRSLRHARGLTLAELAHQVHVSKSTISRWETGQGSRDLPPGIVRLLADALGVSLATVQTAIGHPRDP
jgi:transcriptional regulator with XRE-family HTH domain